MASAMDCLLHSIGQSLPNNASLSETASNLTDYDVDGAFQSREANYSILAGHDGGGGGGRSAGGSYGSSGAGGMSGPEPLLEDVKYYLSTVISPLLCAIGLAGNILNMLVLTRRQIQSAIDCSMEKAAYMGLVALAVSDFLYCLSTLPDAFRGGQEVLFDSRNFWLYYAAGGKYVQNVFSHISTWLTVVMAGGRYAAICHPLHARQFVHAKGTRLAIVVVFVVWSGLALPQLWTFKISHIECPDGSHIFMLDHGSFARNKTLKVIFMYVWTIFGYVIPVCVLAYCNAHLIGALRASYRMRQEYRVHGRTPQHNTRITPTLVAIVIMFIVLVSPSEIIQFIFYAIEGAAVESLNVAIVITNVLHTLNFAINFVLYCAVNSHFRESLRDIFCFGRGKRRFNRKCTYTATYSNVTSRTYAAPSTETIL